MPNNDHEYSDNSPSDNSPSEGDPDSEDKQATESGTESNSSSKQEQSAESKTSSSFSDSSSDKPTKKRDVFSAKEKEPGGSPTFPVKLHLILSNPEFEKIVAWLPHGRAWRILDHKALEEKVIPLYFRHGRYSSFARQINGWGFKRIVHGADYNAYYHEMFLRGMPHLCAKMKRPTSKSNANKEQVDPTDPAPDFYAMSRIQPLPEAGSTEVPPHLAELMEMEKSPKPAVIDDTPSTSSAPQVMSGKPDVLEQIAQLLKQNGQQQQQNQSHPGSNPQLAQILSLLNGNGAAAPPKAAAAPSNQLQQLLSGLGGNNEGPSVQDNNSNPQAQLAALLQQQLQPQQKPPQQKSPQDLLASLLSQNSGQNNQVDMLSNLLNQGGSQNSQQPSILNALMNSGNNPANLLQVLSNQLEQKQQPSQQQQKQQQRDVSSQNQDKTAQQGSQQQQKSSHPTDRSEGDKAEDASQSSAKRQRQSQDVDVSTARSPSVQGMSGNSKSSDPSNIAALLGQLSGQSGGQQQNAVTGALSQLIQSMSQKPSASNNTRPLDILNALQQSSQIPESQQQPKSGNALANFLSLLQQRGSQAGQMGSSNDAILSAVKQLQGNHQGSQQGQDKPAGSQDAVSGLLQQIMGNSQQGQGSDSSGGTSGNPVLDALQSLVRPAQQPAPAAPPANNPFAQLQQLLGQNQPGSSQGFASMQQGPRNNGGPQANSDLLASLGLSQGGNNPNAAMLQQLLKNNNGSNSNNGTNNPSSNQKPQGMINAELLASLGLPNSGPPSGPNSSQQNSQSRNQLPPGLNPQFLASLGLSQNTNRSGSTGSGIVPNSMTGSVNSSSQSVSSANGGNAMRADFSMSQGQPQGRPGGNQQPDNESAARSVAAILSAFNQGKK